jgi:hypothetical protein
MPGRELPTVVLRFSIVLLSALVAATAGWRSSAETLGSPSSLDATARPLAAKAARHAPPAALFANFSGTGSNYVRYPSERAYRVALNAFLNGPGGGFGPGAGGGSYIARVFRDPPGYAYVTFDPTTQGSLSERSASLYEPHGRLVRLHVEAQSYNGYYIIKRDAYFTPGGQTISDVTLRYDYAPTDSTYAHPVRTRVAAPNDIYLSIYTSRSELPFKL